MRIYTLMARLLDYPSAELLAHLPEILEVAQSDPGIKPDEREAIEQMVAWMNLHDLIGLQSDYVNTFDMVPEHSLHLTHHLFGDDNGRGPALIDLSEHYRANGLEIDRNELPDYLPLILEYVATLDDLQAQFFLGDARKVLSVLAENLETAMSPYARLLRVIERRGQLPVAA